MKYIKSIIILSILLFFQLGLVMGQTANHDNFWDRSTVNLNTNLSFLGGDNLSSGYLIDEAGHKFYNSSLLEAKLTYKLNENVSLLGGISYTGFNTKNEYGIMYVWPGPEDAISQFRTTYRFMNFAFEPKAQLNFDLRKWMFFWNAGPVLSGTFLKTDIDGETYAEQNQYRDVNTSHSNGFGLGAQASTGAQYFLNDFLGLRFEIGYRYLNHNTLNTVDPVTNDKLSIHYKTNNFIQRIGLVFKL